LRRLHLLAVGRELERATLTGERPETSVTDHVAELPPEDDLPDFHRDLFGFLKESPGTATSPRSTEKEFDFLRESDFSESDSSSSGSIRIPEAAEISTGSPERTDSGADTNFSVDSDDFDLSLPLPDAPSDGSSQEIPVPEVSSSDSSEDGLFMPSEEDLPEIQMVDVPLEPQPVPRRKPRVSGPKNVVARALRLAEEREHPSDPLSVADFEKWSHASTEDDDGDGIDEFDNLVLTGRGIRERSPEEKTELFDRPEEETEFTTPGNAPPGEAVARETVAKAASEAETGITDTARDLLRGLVPEPDEEPENTGMFSGTLTTDTGEPEPEPENLRPVPLDEEDLIVQVRGRGMRREEMEELEWDPAVALRLLRAHNWMDADQALTSYTSLPGFLGSETPAIADDVFRNFLICDGEDPLFDDPGDIIPDRWRGMDPQIRRQFFEVILTRFLRVYTEQTVANGSQPEPPTIGVVVEPAIAALFFYGVVRLIPEGPIRQSISFSTMEPTTIRLAATTSGDGICRMLAFWSRDTTELRKTLAERIRNMKNRETFSIVDTLAAKPPVAGKPSVYVESQVRRLCEQGWAALLPRISGIEPMKPTTLSQLETAMLVERAVSSLLNRGLFPGDQWRRSPQAMGRFRKELLRRLENSPEPALAFRTIDGGPSHLLTLELIVAKEYPEGIRPFVEYLVERVPPDRMLQLFRRSSVSNDDKIRMLVRHIHDHEGTLPPGFEFLWEDWCRFATDRQPTPTALIMARVLRKLEPEDVGRLMKACPHGRLMGFGESVMALYRQNRLRRHSVAAMWMAMDESTFARVLRQKGCDFIRTYPKEEHGFGRRLEKLILTLPQYPEEFSERLQWLQAGQHYLGEDYQTAVESWSLFASLVQKVSRLQKPDAAPNQEARIRMLVSATHELARCADQAMDFPEINEDFAWTDKRDVMFRLASGLLGNHPLFEKGPWEHDELTQWIDVQFRDHRWPTETFRKGALVREKKKNVQAADTVQAPNSWIVTVACLAVILIVCGTGGYFIWSKIRPEEGYDYEDEYEEGTDGVVETTEGGLSRGSLSDPDSLMSE
ncbi:MAG: hypothetical protein Q4C47_02910, partial [Planctomycetia bacterium]|nr:hypothetical protein [Planctomycetia bacterium]